MIHKLQLGVSVGIFTGVWSNLYIQYGRYELERLKYIQSLKNEKE